MPKVSVILPTYQRAGLVGDVVTGLLAQTLVDFELIVADDGSTDGTADVIRAFDDARLRYLPCPHRGMPAIVNTAYALARGEYILMCHDNNAHDPELLAELAGALDRYPTAAYAYCGVVEVRPDGVTEAARYIPVQPPLLAGADFLVRTLLPGLDSAVSSTAMVRRASLDGRFLDPAFAECADVELWLRLCTRGDVAYVGTPLLTCRQRDETSQFFAIGYKLTGQTLDAKHRFLGVVDNPARRRAIRGQWRRDADVTALAEAMKALQFDRAEHLAGIRAFGRRHGTRSGTLALAMVSRAPRALAVAGLPVARGLWSWLRRSENSAA